MTLHMHRVFTRAGAVDSPSERNLRAVSVDGAHRRQCSTQIADAGYRVLSP